MTRRPRLSQSVSDFIRAALDGHADTDVILARITTTTRLDEALRDADYVQESARSGLR